MISSLVQNGKLQIKVFNKIVDLEHPDVLNGIKKSNPYQIHWNNVPDYYHPKVFFEMAKLCSAPKDTVHYLYSMNWIQTCLGSHILDYNVKERQKLYDVANIIIDEAYGLFGLKEYLVSPPFTNPINIASIPCHEKWKKEWCEKFFA